MNAWNTCLLESGSWISCFLKVPSNSVKVSLQKYNAVPNVLCYFPCMSKPKVPKKESWEVMWTMVLFLFLAFIFCTFLRQTWALGRTSPQLSALIFSIPWCSHYSNSYSNCCHLLRTYYVPGTMVSILFTFYLHNRTTLEKYNYPYLQRRKLVVRKVMDCTMTTELLSDTATIRAQVFWPQCAFFQVLYFPYHSMGRWPNILFSRWQM